MPPTPPSPVGSRASPTATERRALPARPLRLAREASLAPLTWVTLLVLGAAVPPLSAQDVSWPGRWDARAACHRALAGWTLGRARDARPFHLRPVVDGLLASRGDTVPGRIDTGIGFGGRSGVLRAGETVPSEDGFRYPGPEAQHRRPGPFASLLVRRRAGRLAVLADVAAGDDVELAAGGLAVRLGRSLVLSAGREALWPGSDCSDGLVLSGRGKADGVGLDTPWWHLPVLGTLSLSTFLGTLREASSDNRRPFFTVLRVVWAAGDDVRVGLTRGAIFGGRATSVPVTLRTVGLMLLGFSDVPGKDSDFENQVASLDVSWRTVVSGRPLRLHMEYGVDDSGWAFIHVPAISLGAELLVPEEEGFRTMGTQLVWIAPSTGSYPEWYRHGALAWGWTDRGVLLGHELGGEGWGLLLDGFRSAEDGEYGARLLVSRRGEENLLAPAAAGWGIEGRIEGTRVLGRPSRGSLLAGGRLAAGALGHQRYLAGEVLVAYRF